MDSLVGVAPSRAGTSIASISTTRVVADLLDHCNEFDLKDGLVHAEDPILNSGFGFDGLVHAEELSPDEQKERKIMKLFLKVKNGTPPQRKTALRKLTDKAREFDARPLFNQILPLLMSPTLED